nr:putative toxin-antitoxin system toxin component, PIN family [Nanoarchaeum sp.]
MLRVTADTNILVSATICAGNEYELLKLAKLGKIKLMLSPHILAEFKGVISRPKFGFNDKQISEVSKQLLMVSEVVMPNIKVNVIKEDPADNHVLECALSGKADYIVSGDKHLLDLKKYEKVKIFRTWAMLKIIKV